jgi:hypothetical protein
MITHTASLDATITPMDEGPEDKQEPDINNQKKPQK